MHFLFFAFAFICAVLVLKVWGTVTGRMKPSASVMKGAGEQEWSCSLLCISHEIRNYSSTLRGNAKLLRMRLSSGSALEPLERLERTTEKIECLARNILESAAGANAELLRELKVQEVIEGCIGEHFDDKRGAFRIYCEGDPKIECDALKLERAFLNLFKNAFEAGATNVNVRVTSPPHGARVLVEDNGKGCSAEQVRHLFRPLFTTKKGAGGTGLGLYLVRSILEAHGGSIRAITKNLWGGRETGMIFCIEFPNVADPKAQRLQEIRRFVLLLKPRSRS